MHPIECNLATTFRQIRDKNPMEKTQLSQTVKDLRKEFGMTQEELAMKSGVGLNFVRNLEQGKPTLRMDKVNQLLDLFNYTLVAAPRFNEG